MDVFEAVDSRISCRCFLDRPVDPALVRKLIAGAARAASGGNLQPWHVYALTGAALAELKRRVAASITDRDPRHEEAEYPIYPKTMWEPYRSRREHHGVQLYGALNIDRDDASARLVQYKRNFASSMRRWHCLSLSIAGSVPASGPISAAMFMR